MEEKGPKILSEDEDFPKLHPTPPVPGQEYVAYTYLLIKEPKTPEYGILKIICTGPTRENVEDRVAKLIKTGEIEPEIPFVSVRRTGRYHPIIAGGDPKVLKDGVDVQTGQIYGEAKKVAAEKRKAEMKEMERRMDDLSQSSQEKVKTSDDFEQYKYFRVQAMMAQQKEKQLEEELKNVKKIQQKAGKGIIQLERQFGTFKQRFVDEMETNRRAHKDQMEAARERLLKEQEGTEEQKE